MEFFKSKKNILVAVVTFILFSVIFLGSLRFIHDKYVYKGVKITIPEGYNVADIAGMLGTRFPGFDSSNFIALAKDKEGFLFPDTYNFFPSVKPMQVVDVMSKNFYKKIKSLEPDIEVSQKSLNDIITMASIIEKEAGAKDDRNIIAGILWKRIKLGIRLQVDAAPETYKSAGLPQKPICNPGLPSILAAVYPKDSPYLYYLHDKDGKIHYATTFEEHKLNKQKYLQ